MTAPNISLNGLLATGVTPALRTKNARYHSGGVCYFGAAHGSLTTATYWLGARARGRTH
jgi:hypothetical protein